MCEYCHQIIGHLPRCPNAPEPKIRGHCEHCKTDLREDYEFYIDRIDNKFCSSECAMEYHGIKAAEWNYE